jgi:hypothetical protein
VTGKLSVIALSTDPGLSGSISGMMQTAISWRECLTGVCNGGLQGMANFSGWAGLALRGIVSTHDCDGSCHEQVED